MTDSTTRQDDGQWDGTSDVVVRSPALGAPWDYAQPPGTDLRGAQFTPRLRPPRRHRPTQNRNRDYPDSDTPATGTAAAPRLAP